MVGSESMGNSRILMTFGPPILRVMLGTLFITNGWPKHINLSQTQGYFNMIGSTCRIGPINRSS